MLCGFIIHTLWGFVLPVATMIPGAESLVEIVPDKYGFSDICNWRWSEQKGWKKKNKTIGGKEIQMSKYSTRWKPLLI